MPTLRCCSIGLLLDRLNPKWKDGYPHRTPLGSSSAIEAFTEALARDVRSPIVDPPASAKDAYPISGLTFILVAKDGKGGEERQAIKEFFHYAVIEGQAAEELSYAMLPVSLQKLDQKLLGEMTADCRFSSEDVVRESDA